MFFTAHVTLVVATEYASGHFHIPKQLIVCALKHKTN